jgi:hypothetical protein
MAGATFLLLGAGAAAVSAADTDGNNIALTGSDTLLEVTQQVLNNCKDASGTVSVKGAPYNISYQGGGSGVGAGNMAATPAPNQKIAPMSRPMKKSEYCGVANGSAGSTSQALLLGLDGVSNMVGSENACGPDLAQVGRFFNYPDPVNGPNKYTFTGSMDVLRVLYAGLDNGGTGPNGYNCAGDIRKNLVKQWSKIFNQDCGAGKCDGSTTAGITQPGGLTHIWRRSDLSGTTDAFVSLVNMGARKIGGNPIITGAATAVNPFCNSNDATTNVGSLGGTADYTDVDPIRTPCDPNDTVCEIDGTLGLVLPVLLPEISGGLLATDAYPANSGAACTGCILSQTGGGNGQPCPRGGPLLLGRCFQPATGAGDTHCNALKSKKCFGDLNTADGRAYNLPLKVAGGTEPAKYLVDGNKNRAVGSFFRIHQASSSSYSANANTCQFMNDTQQIGCLAAADPCSLGYAGREADQVAVTGGNQAETVDGLTSSSGPTGDQLVKNLLLGGAFCDSTHACPDPVNTTCNLVFKQCFANGTSVYPIARKLWLATSFGFANLTGGEDVTARCFADNNNAGNAIAAFNFLKIPAGITCVDYDETAVSALAPPQVPPGCDLGGTNVDMCDAAHFPAGYIH